MPNIIVPNFLGESIKINGICYRFLGKTQTEPTINGVIDYVAYDNCDNCDKNIPASSSSSSSSVPSEFDCSDITKWQYGTVTVDISGTGSGSCVFGGGAITCADLAGTYPLSNIGGGTSYRYFEMSSGKSLMITVSRNEILVGFAYQNCNCPYTFFPVEGQGGIPITYLCTNNIINQTFTLVQGLGTYCNCSDPITLTLHVTA
jgi:hypothetical protein